MKLFEDIAQQKSKHEKKHNYWKQQGIEFEQIPLPVADYVMWNEKIQDVIDRKNHRGIKPKKMDFLGTYDICVDTKKDIQEIINNVCGVGHDRFRDECLLAQNNGIKMYVLIDDDGGYVDKKHTIYNKPVTCIDDLFGWKNPRAFIWRNGKQLYPHATKGSVLAKAMITMQNKYGVKFLFCKSSDSGKKVIELLTMDGE